KTLAVRGAPAIGVAAAYGLVLGMQKPAAATAEEMVNVLKDSCEYLASARPTAVNLFWALNRVSQKAQAFIAGRPAADPKAIRQLLLSPIAMPAHWQPQAAEPPCPCSLLPIKGAESSRYMPMRPDRYCRVRD
ncbi:MAG: hypothetical protein ACYSW6_10210, partial [Planctomycetota bacterium]